MKPPRRKHKATVTDLTALRELDAFIKAHGGLAPFRGYSVKVEKVEETDGGAVDQLRGADHPQGR